MYFSNAKFLPFEVHLTPISYTTSSGGMNVHPTPCIRCLTYSTPSEYKKTALAYLKAQQCMAGQAEINCDTI